MRTTTPAALLALTLCVSACSLPSSENAPQTSSPDQKEWVDLFNGNDLNDWTIKFRGYPAGENLADIFGVEDGKLIVNYDDFGEFDGEFGHIIYNKRPYSHYIVRVEYRFVGDQAADGPGWAFRNNGIMYHSQSAEEMEQDQDFPVSLEYQLLGGDGENERTTANLCTPGTHVVMDGELQEQHCMVSNSKTFHGDQWVTVELEVHGDQMAEHRVEGETVMRYSGLQLDDGTALDSGYIALQAESHPTEFRSVQLLNLEGCMDETASNYKSYFVENDPNSCER